MDNENLLNEIFERGVLIDLHVTWWRGRKGIKPEDIGLDKSEINQDLFSLGQKRLLPREFTREWGSCDIQGRKVIDDYSFRYGNRLGHFVPINAVSDLVARLEALKARFMKTVNTFCRNYTRIVTEMKKAYAKESKNIYKRLKKSQPKMKKSFSQFKKEFMGKLNEYYPSQSPRSSFTYTFTFYEFSLPRDHKIKLAKITKKERAKVAKQDALIKSYKKNADVQVNEFLNNAVSKLRAATAELFTKLSEQVSGGKITDTRIERIQEFITRFRNLNFLNDYEVSRQLDDLGRLVKNKKAEQFNSDEKLGEALSKALKGVITSATKKETGKVVSKALKLGRKVK